MANESSLVLVAEDDGLLQKVFRTKFEKAGYRVIVTGDGEETMEALRNNHPDILLLDIRMPKKDGFQVLGEMKKDPKLSEVPVMILSNLSQDPDIETGQALGAIDYIVKSDVGIADVVKKVGEYLGN